MSGYLDGHQDYRRECPRCGDPLPADGSCDCAGDPERDTVTGWRELHAHALVVRLDTRAGLGPKTDEDSGIVEMWV